MSAIASLVPGPGVRAALADDYGRMREMIFGDPPDIEQILSIQSELEAEINSV